MNTYHKIGLLSFLLFCINLQDLWAQTRLQEVATYDTKAGWIYIKPEQKIKPLAFFQTFGKDLGLDSDNQMQMFKETEDELKWKHYRFQQLYKNIPVEYATMTVHAKNERVEKVNGDFVANISQNIVATKTGVEALQFALRHLGKKKYTWEQSKDTIIANAHKQIPALPKDEPKGDLVLTLRDISGKFSNDNLVLAYRFPIFYFEEGYSIDGYNVYVDAKTGDIVNSLPLAHKCDPQMACTNQQRYPSVTVQTKEQGAGYWYPTFYWKAHCNYWSTWWGGFWTGCWVTEWHWAWLWHYWDLHDDCQANEITTLNEWLLPIMDNDGYWECGTFSATKSNGTTAHWAAKQTYEYFLNQHSRVGIDNGGGGDITIRMDNVYSLTFALPYINLLNIVYNSGTNSDTYATLDVLGHEYTHLVTHNSVGNVVGLVYAYEPGALNESFSNIFSDMTEFQVLGSQGNYYHNEDHDFDADYTDSWNHSAPDAYMQPDTYLSSPYWISALGCIPTPSQTTGTDMCGVHTNSAVQDYWFYLLAESGNGTNYNGNTYCVKGIGKEKAAKIAYRNLTNYITSLSGFYDARNGSIQAAIDLYGANSFEVNQVVEAWYAVGVGSNYVAYATLNGISHVDFSTQNYSNLNNGTGGNEFHVNHPVQISDIEAWGTQNANGWYDTDIYFTSNSVIDIVPSGWGNHIEDNASFAIEDVCSSKNVRINPGSPSKPSSSTSQTVRVNETQREANEPPLGEKPPADIEYHFYAYPSPCKSTLLVEYRPTPETKPPQVAIYDLMGNEVRTFSFDGYNPNPQTKEIDMSNLAIGVYLVSYTTEHGVISQKIIKE